MARTIATGAALAAVHGRIGVLNAEFDRMTWAANAVGEMPVSSDTRHAFETVGNALWEKRSGFSRRLDRLYHFADTATDAALAEWATEHAKEGAR